MLQLARYALLILYVLIHVLSCSLVISIAGIIQAVFLLNALTEHACQHQPMGQINFGTLKFVSMDVPGGDAHLMQTVAFIVDICLHIALCNIQSGFQGISCPYGVGAARCTCEYLGMLHYSARLSICKSFRPSVNRGTL